MLTPRWRSRRSSPWRYPGLGSRGVLSRDIGCWLCPAQDRPSTGQPTRVRLASGVGAPETPVRSPASQAEVSSLRADHAPRFPGKHRIPATCPCSTANPGHRTRRSGRIQRESEEAHRPSLDDLTFACGACPSPSDWRALEPPAVPGACGERGSVRGGTEPQPHSPAPARGRPAAA
jgi:hypothetical protein